MKSVLAGAMHLSLSQVDLDKVRKDLTFKVYTPGEEEPAIVRAWSAERRGYISVPRQYGIKTFKNIACKDSTSAGQSIESALTPVELFDYQIPWVDNILNAFNTRYDLIAKAATGKGKTVMSLEVIRRLNRKALVVVDQNFLKDQWYTQAKFFLGIPEDKIGFVQGDVCDYEGKDIVVAMIQTLYSRTFTNKFYEYFGTVVFDESHTVGAPVFSKVLMQFPARYRFGVSATPDRRDALNTVIQYNIGTVEVVLDKVHRPSVVRYLEHDGVYSWYANISPKTGRFITEVSEDSSRNLLIARAIKWLYDSGRHVLAVSDRIEHVESLMALCRYLGIPPDHMGTVTGYTNTWRYAKNPLPKRKPKGLEKDADYTPVKLQLIAKRTPKKVLDEIKNTKQVIFSTYGMFSKGVDVPRLSAGIDCTPRSQAQQVHGRILRDDEDKQVPIWVTIRDVNSFRSEYQFGQRIREYVKSNAEIYKWVLGKGIKRQEPKLLSAEALSRATALKERKITTKPDGSYTVQTQSTETRLRSKSGSSTVKTTLRSRQSS
jgi:superfamily II DNA or RNA helicase